METNSKPSFTLDLPPDGLQLGDNGVPSPLYSPYDMLETARVDAHQLLASLRRFAGTWGLPWDPAEELEALAGKLERLVSNWEDIVDGLQGVRREVEPLSFQLSELRLELSRLQAERSEQQLHFNRQLQHVQAQADQHLSDLSRDLDELLHQRLLLHKPKQDFGNILPVLFSEEDLLEEQKVALGEQARVRRDEKIKKLELSHESGPKWELGHSSGQSESVSLSAVPDEDRGLVAQLQAMKRKVQQYRRKEDLPRSSNPTIDRGIFAQLAMESASDLDFRPRTESYRHLGSALFPVYRQDLALPLAGIAFTPAGQDYSLVLHSSLSVSKRESLLFSLLNGRREAFERDVQLDDLLNVTNERISQDTDSVREGPVERREGDRNEATEEFVDREDPLDLAFRESSSSQVLSFYEPVDKRASPIHIPHLHLERLSPKPTSPSFLKSSGRADLANLSAFEGASSISLVLEEEKRESPVNQKFDLFEAFEDSSGRQRPSEEGDLRDIKHPSKPASSPPGVNPRRLQFRLLHLGNEKNETAHLFQSPTSLAYVIANTSVPMPDILVSKPSSPARQLGNPRLRKYRPCTIVVSPNI